MNKVFGVALVATMMTAGAAAAATVGFTEGLRPLVDGTSAIPGVDSMPPGGFDVGALNGGSDAIEIFGRIAGDADVFTFTANTDFNFEFIGPSVVGSFVGSGFTPDAASDVTATFTLESASGVVFATSFTTVVDPFVVATGIAPGEYTLTIDSDDASNAFAGLYDIRLTAVPVPAALPMLLAAIGGLGYLGRRRLAT